MGKQMRILIAEDNDDFRELLKERIERDGHEVMALQDGTEILAQVEAFVPDIVVTDMIMPNTEGIELILAIKSKKPRLPVIAMSGGGKLSADWHLQTAEKFGADLLLTKPFRIGDLITEIEKLV